MPIFHFRWRGIEDSDNFMYSIWGVQFDSFSNLNNKSINGSNVQTSTCQKYNNIFLEILKNKGIASANVSFSQNLPKPEYIFSFKRDYSQIYGLGMKAKQEQLRELR